MAAGGVSILGHVWLPHPPLLREVVMNRAFALLLLLVLVAPAGAAEFPAAFSVAVTGHGPPVVLIPGLSCAGNVWRDTVDRYRDSHALHVLTLAGFAGRPAVAGAPFLARVRDELARYIRQHELSRPIIIGHSLGGFVALWLAATAPDLMGGVVVVDAVPFLPALDDPAATVETVRPRAEMLRTVLGGASAAQFAAQTRAALAGMMTHPRDVEAIAASAVRSDPAAVAQAVFEMMTTDLRDVIGRIPVPTLVMAAANGEPVAVTQAAYDRQYARLPGHRLVVAARARHFIMLDDPTFFFGQLDDFFARRRGT
jgi:pimeloyl-ACP methyl ester carboxylesterase